MMSESHLSGSDRLELVGQLLAKAIVRKQQGWRPRAASLDLPDPTLLSESCVAESVSMRTFARQRRQANRSRIQEISDEQ